MTNQTTVVLSIHCIPETTTYFANLHDGRKHYVVPLMEGEAEEMAAHFEVTIRNIIVPPQQQTEIPFDNNQTVQP